MHQVTRNDKLCNLIVAQRNFDNAASLLRRGREKTFVLPPLSLSLYLSSFLSYSYVCLLVDRANLTSPVRQNCRECKTSLKHSPRREVKHGPWPLPPVEISNLLYLNGTLVRGRDPREDEKESANF